MPGPVQLGELTTRVRRRADMESSTFCTDAEIEEYIEQSLGELFDLIIESNGARHWIASTRTHETIAGTAAYTDLEVLPQLPAPIYKVIGVDVLWNGIWRKVRPAGMAEWNAQADSTGGWTDWESITYQFYQAASLDDVTEVTGLQQVFRFSPTPQGVHYFRVRFIPYPNDWSSAPTTFLQAYSGWDEYIVCDAAAKCLEKEESFDHAERLWRRKEATADRIRWHARTMNEDWQGKVRELDEERTFLWPPRALS